MLHFLMSSNRRVRKPARKFNPTRDFRTKISNLLVHSALDNDDFLPEGYVSQLITGENVSSLLPGAPPSLVQFVCHRARKVFLTVLWCCDASQIGSVMESFRQHELTDDHLPIDNIAKDGTCMAEEELECTHDVALDAFHHDPWEPHNVSHFYKDQWIFCSPVFKKTDFKQKLKAGSILPFTWVSKNQMEGHFSTVFEAKLHADHQDEFSRVRRRGSLDGSFCTNYTTGG